MSRRVPPRPVDPATVCECGGFKDPRANRCKPCADSARTTDKPQLAAVMRSQRVPVKDIAARLGVSLGRAYKLIRIGQDRLA